MKFALAGNPNSGKTTLFNTLTGSSARVGNWPGVTVDKKEGIIKYRSQNVPPDAGNGEWGKIHLVDLPGIYSLSPYTPEEVIARQFIVEEKPDAIINIVDATNLERNLYLTTQLLEMDIPVVVALNMMDVIKREGAEIDADALAERLGVPVAPISALNAGDARMLIRKVMKTVAHWRQATESRQPDIIRGSTPFDRRPPVVGGRQSPLAGLYREVLPLVAAHGIEHPVFHTVKLLENDAIELLHDTELTAAIQNRKLQFEQSAAAVDYEAEIADLRYKFITDEVKPAVVKSYKNKSQRQSEKIDNVLTHRIWGFPVFLLILFAVFHLIFAADFLFLERLGILSESIPSPGVLLQGYTQMLQTFAGGQLAALLQNAGAAPWATGLLVNGLVNGVCSVLTFLPQILLLFLFLSILEDTGYMSRVAFLMDRPMRRFGLSGKAILPMLMGFGCSVPAMMGTRTLDNAKEKRLTLILIPFFSCGAKLAIWSIIVAAIFPENADFVVLAVYAAGIAVAALAALALKKTVFKNNRSNFVLELPVYRLPRLKNTSRYLWDKLKGFLITVTTIVAAATIVIWFLQNFTFRLEMLEPGNSVHSMLGQIGSAIQWIFVPLGFAQGPEGWKLIVAILTGLIAKELVVATMGILYIPGFSEDAVQTQAGESSLIAMLAGLAVFSPLTAITFMIFNLLSIPCFAAVATAFSELKSMKWTAFVLFFWLAVAWSVSFLVYQIGSLLLQMNVATIVVLFLALSILGGSILYAATHKSKKKCMYGSCDNCDRIKN